MASQWWRVLRGVGRKGILWQHCAVQCQKFSSQFIDSALFFPLHPHSFSDDISQKVCRHILLAFLTPHSDKLRGCDCVRYFLFSALSCMEFPSKWFLSILCKKPSFHSKRCKEWKLSKIFFKLIWLTIFETFSSPPNSSHATIHETSLSFLSSSNWIFSSSFSTLNEFSSIQSFSLSFFHHHQQQFERSAGKFGQLSNMRMCFLRCLPFTIMMLQKV